MNSPEPPEARTRAGDTTRYPHHRDRDGQAAQENAHAPASGAPPGADQAQPTDIKHARIVAAARAYAQAHTQDGVVAAEVVGAGLLREDGTRSWMVCIERGGGRLLFVKVHVTLDDTLDVVHYYG